jgi:hypothetical protein
MVPVTELRGRYFLPLTTGVRNVASHMIACAAAGTNHKTSLHFARTLPVQVRHGMILRQLPFGVLRGMQQVGSSGVGLSGASEIVTYCM